MQGNNRFQQSKKLTAIYSRIEAPFLWKLDNNYTPKGKNGET